MIYSPKQRIEHLNRLEKHISHIIKKREAGDGTHTFLKELILAVDMEIFMPTMTQDEWEALPLEEKYTQKEIEEMMECEV